MRNAVVTPAGDRIRWAELPGAEPARVYIAGLGATAPPYWAGAAAHPLLVGRRSLLLDPLGFGISDRPADFDHTLESHADTVATALRSAAVSGAEVIGHSMGGALAIVLAARHPDLVAKLLVVDGNLDARRPERGGVGSWGIASYTEEEFVHGGGWEEFAELAGEEWMATMRLCGREAVYRSAVHLARGSTPVMRELLCGLRIPRTFIWPEADGPFPGAEGLVAAGVRMVAVPECGHNVMLDNPEGFAHAAAEALG